ncbi:MAG: two-component regulator propeller domain-containing protein [Bacteroidales bacterium]
MKVSIFIVLLFVIIQTLFAQETRKFFKFQTPLNQLVSGNIYAIHKDSKGYLWIAATNGLIRYDGYNLIPINSLPHKNNDSEVETIFEDSHNTLWFGSKYGLFRFDYDTFQFKQVTNKLHPLSSTRIKKIAQQNDSILWIATYGKGLCRFNILNNSSFVFTHSPLDTNSLPSDFVNTVFIDSKNRIWVGTESGGLSLLQTKNKNFINFTSTTNKNKLLSDNTVSCISEDNEGFIWIGTWRGGITKMNPQTFKTELYPHNPLRPRNSPPSNTIREMVIDMEGYIWLATFGGLSRLTPKNNTFVSYSKQRDNQQSISHNVLWSLHIDKSNTLWIGTFGKGVVYTSLNKELFRSLSAWHNSPYSVKSEFVSSICTDNKRNRLWIGTDDGGAGCIDLNTWKYLPFSGYDLLRGLMINEIYNDRNGNILFGTNYGLYAYSNQKNQLKEIFPQVLSKKHISRIKQDSAGVFWIGGWKTGLIKIVAKNNDIFENPLQITIYQPDSTNHLPSDRIWFIYPQNNDKIWLSTSDGVGYFSANESKYYPVSEQNNVYSITSDINNTIYIGNTDGIIYKIKNSKPEPYFTIPIKNYSISTLYIDSNNIFYLTSDKGIFIKSGETERYITEKDGLKSWFINRTFTITKNNTLYYGSAEGIIAVETSELQKQRYSQPIIKITAIDIADKPADMERNPETPFLKKSLHLESSITVPYNKNKITFYFSLHDLTGTSNRFKYRLKNFDEQWVTIINEKPLANYTGLQPGTYTFEVFGCNSHGVWSQTPAQFTLIITPPWWKTLWFRIALWTSIAILLILFYLIRTMNIRKTNILLTNEVKKRTQELQNVNELLQINNQNLEESNKELEKRAKTIAQQQQELQQSNSILQQTNAELQENIFTKNKLFSIIAHDVRSPLAAIIGISEMLSKMYADIDDHERINMIEQMNISANNAEQLLTNLLS